MALAVATRWVLVGTPIAVPVLALTLLVLGAYTEQAVDGLEWTT